jgi:hypothetical protein
MANEVKRRKPKGKKQDEPAKIIEAVDQASIEQEPEPRLPEEPSPFDFQGEIIRRPPREEAVMTEQKLTAQHIRGDLKEPYKIEKGTKKKDRESLEQTYYSGILTLFLKVLSGYFSNSTNLTAQRIWNRKSKDDKDMYPLYMLYEVFRKEVMLAQGSDKKDLFTDDQRTQIHLGIELASQEVWLHETYPALENGKKHPTVEALDKIGLVYRDFLRAIPNDDRKKDAIKELLEVPIKELTKVKAKEIVDSHSTRARYMPTEADEPITLDSAIERLKNEDLQVLLSQNWGNFMMRDAIQAKGEGQKRLANALISMKEFIHSRLIAPIDATMRIIGYDENRVKAMESAKAE